MKRIGLVFVLVLQLIGCTTNGARLSIEDKPCDFVTHDGWCHCARGGKEVWTRTGTVASYYEGCYGKKHPYWGDPRINAIRKQQANEELAEKILDGTLTDPE